MTGRGFPKNQVAPGRRASGASDLGRRNQRRSLRLLAVLSTYHRENKQAQTCSGREGERRHPKRFVLTYLVPAIPSLTHRAPVRCP
jgi:hypothetical protein